ncbi:MAG: AAA family ATPase, partial [Cardiobacterium sp.]
EEIQNQPYAINLNHIPFNLVKISSLDKILNINQLGTNISLSVVDKILDQKFNLPLVYITAQNRSNLKKHSDFISRLGNRKDRASKYFEKIFGVLWYDNQDLRDLNSDINIQEWIIQRAQSSNPYQSKEDNREIEITTLLKLLNQIDERIDADYLEISGDNRVFIKIENQKRELSELSSGFTSIFKIIQAIIAGYSYFTNEVQIANVRGIVLIDEIESHLHNEWQVKIIPLLKQLFPNTTFFITTHSSLVISQLEDGEAYRLQRETDGVVYGKAIAHPSNASFIDLLNEAFNVDLNKLKIERAQGQSESQKAAKQALLELVQQELAKGKEK